MACTLARGAPPLVVDLRRRDVPMAEQLLDLGDVHTGIEQQRRRKQDHPRGATGWYSFPATH